MSSGPIGYTNGGGTHVPHDSALGLEDAARIKSLEEEVRELTEKVASASQRFADYENEIRVLQAQVRQEKRRNASVDTTNGNSPQTPPQQTEAPRPGISRFGSFMHSRKATALQQSPIPPPPPIPGVRERELEAALVAEQTQRIAAEQKVKDVTGEIEDLSATLFTQANEMVSKERREKAGLMERIQLLEGRDAKFALRVQAMEQRELERKRRLELLEQAQKRVERVGAMLVPR